MRWVIPKSQRLPRETFHQEALLDDGIERPVG